MGEGDAVGDSAPKALANHGRPQVGLKDEEGLGLHAVYKTANVGVEVGRDKRCDHSVGGGIAVPALDSAGRKEGDEDALARGGPGADERLEHPVLAP